MTRARVSGKQAAGETTEELRVRARRILALLQKQFPRAATELRNENPFQLLIATILSAQCTDERVNKVTPGLFAAYPGPREFAGARKEELEQQIRSTGFFRSKAKSIMACSAALVERHKGTVPSTMDELIQLPGVGRKTANVVLGQSFGIASGVVVDTHVQRLAQRMGFTAATAPEPIEQDLMAVFPKKNWIDVGSLLILHGRRTCKARTPLCGGCAIRELCPSADAFKGKSR